jgi:RNA polymerase sigma factor (sigma-70 family)
MREPLNIAKWVQAAEAGDEMAWSHLHYYYYPDLYSKALQLCNNTAAAKDMVQESFVTAWLKLSQLKDPASFGGWLKKILVHQCYRYRNSQRTHHNLTADRPVSDGSLADLLEEKLDKAVTSSRLLASIAALPETLCTTLLLRYFTAYQSYQAIAGILSIPVGTVRSRLNEAKLKLTANWQQPIDTSDRAFRESHQWNQFYGEILSGMHQQDDYKNRFLVHLQKDMLIVTPGKPDTGNLFFENMIANDRQFGSWLQPVAIHSCGNISVVESRHYNSTDHPDHCPEASVMVLYRQQHKVSKMNIHISTYANHLR